LNKDINKTNIASDIHLGLHQGLSIEEGLSQVGGLTKNNFISYEIDRKIMHYLMMKKVFTPEIDPLDHSDLFTRNFSHSSGNVIFESSS